MVYNWQYPTWPHFLYKPEEYEDLAHFFLQKSAYASGVLDSVDLSGKNQFALDILVQEAIRSSAIEGEFLSRPDMVSSIKRQLGWPTPAFPIRDQAAAGIAELVVKARLNFADDLTETVLFDWHRWLMQANKRIHAGQWRFHEEPMQVISGAAGREVVHYEAPPSERVPSEMRQFIQWFNQSKPNGKKPIKNPLIRTALSHLYVESIHPFEDGNGRIGRVIAEKALSQHLGHAALLSLSSIIEANKNDYYAELQKAQRSLDCGSWIYYFAKMILQAQSEFTNQLAFSIRKAHFFDKWHILLNDRQQKVIAKILESGEGNFIGGMNTRKYQSITKTSKATPTRDLQDLVAKKILTPMGAGRSTAYQINLEA